MQNLQHLFVLIDVEQFYKINVGIKRDRYRNTSPVNIRR